MQSPRGTKPALAFLFVLAATAAAGCSGSDYGIIDAVDEGACQGASVRDVTLYLDGDRLVPTLQAPGEVAANGFSEGFLTNELREFLSDAMEEGMVIDGNVTLEYWVEYAGSTAPLAMGGDPGEGYHFFNQFGSDVTFQLSYVTEYGPVAVAPGTIVNYTETFTMPAGGFVVEEGQKVRLLLTGLLGETPATQTNILTGIGHPSAVRFQARCFATHHWHQMQEVRNPVILLGNQGLLTGAVPPTEGVNMVTIPFKLLPGTDRLTIRLEQSGSDVAGKDDVDMEVLDADGNILYSEGSPYTDETLVLWQPNLEAFLPPGATYQVRVHSYSAINYSGYVTVVMDEADEGASDHPAGEEHDAVDDHHEAP